MSTATVQTTAANSGDRRSGVVFTLLRWTGALIFVVFLSLLFSIIAEWVGMTWIWDDERSSHAKDMLTQELSFLHEDFVVGAFASPAGTATAAGAAVVSRTWINSGIRDWHRSMMVPVGQHAPEGIALIRNSYQAISDYLVAAGYTIVTFSVRLVVALMALPVFMLFGIAALVDGLVERDLRRFGGGREYGFLYHNIKPLMFPAISISVFLYLGVPYSIHPNWIFPPAAAWFGLLVFLTAFTFKKHL